MLYYKNSWGWRLASLTASSCQLRWRFAGCLANARPRNPWFRLWKSPTVSDACKWRLRDFSLFSMKRRRWLEKVPSVLATLIVAIRWLFIVILLSKSGESNHLSGYWQEISCPWHLWPQIASVATGLAHSILLTANLKYCSDVFDRKSQMSPCKTRKIGVNPQLTSMRVTPSQRVTQDWLAAALHPVVIWQCVQLNRK